jgi:hypothetical protein
MARATSQRLERPEAEEVARWRLDRLVEAGYDHDTASFLAQRAEVDLHVAVMLVGQGCPLETAVRILI